MRARRALGGLLLLLGLAAGPLATAPAGASTGSTDLAGEGGSFLQPVTDQLLKDDGSALSPIFGTYINVKLDNAIKDFVGSAPGQFGADWVVSERPLTGAEATTAQKNGRTFAYVPFAATPVAVVTLVPNSLYTGGTTITPGDFCRGMPLTLTDIAQIYGYDASQPLNNWADSRLSCSTTSGGPTAGSRSITLFANLDPTMENQAMMELLDSTTASKQLFQDGLDNAQKNSAALTTSTTPSETWPYKGGVPGGDQPLIGKLLAINSLTGAPNTEASQWALGATGPISSVWTGAPLGVQWDLPSAAVQNAAGAYVAPSASAAAASEADASLAKTTDPTTNNLVTFTASSSDQAAYNNYLMEESYLVVPTNGLSPQKAVELAQFIRFVLGPAGQEDITQLGAAPATPAMVTAGLQVAAAVNAEAPPGSTTSSSSTTTTAAAGTGTTVAGSGTSPTGTAGTTTGGGSGSGLAFTGAGALLPWLAGLGALLAVTGAALRRRSRRRQPVRIET